MKKILLALTFLSCAFFGTMVANAETTKVEVDLSKLKYTSYIIGNRIYDATYELSLYDIVSASTEYTLETDEQAPIYLYKVSYSDPTKNKLYEFTGPIDDEGNESIETVEDINTEFPGAKMEATKFNDTPVAEYVSTNFETELADAAQDLNDKELAKGDEKGFESIVYDEKTNTATFTIYNRKANLADYQDSGIIEYFLTIVKHAKAISYSVDDVNYTNVDLTEFADLDEEEKNGKVIEIAYALLSELSENAKVLNYESVANKKAYAKVEFEGYDYSDKFVLHFVYDILANKDKELDTYAKDLHAKEIAKGDEKGFESIVYAVDKEKNERVGTFTIADLGASLADYQNSGIVGFFLEFIKDADTLKYKVENGEYTPVDLTKFADLDEEERNGKVIEIAYALLSELSGNAKVLNYESVANKTAYAEVTYTVNGVEYTTTYTLKFVYDILGNKDKELTAYAQDLNYKESLKEKPGFESIVYTANPEKNERVGTFTIADLEASLADYQNSGIVEFFLEFIKDADTLKYRVENGEYTPVDLTKFADLDEEERNGKVIEIAYALLSELSGNAKVLNYESVANKTAYAEVTYTVNGVEYTTTYTLKFVYDILGNKDKELDTYAKDLNYKESLKEEPGFESIVYDLETKTGTFTIANPNASLADYQNSGIVGFFLEFIKDADSIKYRVENGAYTPVDLTEFEDLDEEERNAKVIEIAYALLSELSGNAEVLNYASVANKTAEAEVTYTVNGKQYTETYKLFFANAE